MEDLINEVQEYCDEYDIPEEYLFKILKDSKVVPMIRGKATEYNAFLYLRKHLNKDQWLVEKLNLNAQNNMYDEDVSITSTTTGIRLKVEVKNACRGSFSTGSRQHKYPFFKVKCHRSRSNMSKADTTNDRYIVGEFDLLVCNPSNALYEGATFEEHLQIKKDQKLIDLLYKHYHVTNEKALVNACNNDWRFVFPSDIAEDKDGQLAIPRTPFVHLENDPHWTTIENLESRLQQLVVKKYKRRRR